MPVEGEDAFDEMPEKPSGMGSFLASIRLIFNNPITRSYLKASSKRVRCIEDGREVEAPIIYHSLAALAGLRVTGCPVTARFLSW
ncbi:MAG: radical SAM/SPASM domain-containing protein, partial [Desulfurococcales archaeon]|nr:radical SAM/SPASM domain-containing protein [Desulfurococcales archaeon]